MSVEPAAGDGSAATMIRHAPHQTGHKPERNLVACDQCHLLKIKCSYLSHKCGRCKRLNLSCTSERVKHKRGRKPKIASPNLRPTNSSTRGEPDDENVFWEEHKKCYPVLNCLISHGVYIEKPRAHITNGPRICSLEDASRLLDHFYSSPNQEFHTRIIRKCNLLDINNPRITSPALLSSLLCLACYMPTENDTPPLPHLGNGEFVTIRRTLLALAFRFMEPVMTGKIEPSLDDAITSFMLASIGPSENNLGNQLPQWLNFMKLSVKTLNLCTEPVDFSDEEKEERRRVWWGTYIIDRHSSFSFNLRPHFSDMECQHLTQPCPDSAWGSSIPLREFNLNRTQNLKGITYSAQNLDLFGVMLPLSRILGEILEYHFLRRHPTFGSHRQFMEDIRQNIEQNLQFYHRSLHSQLTTSSLSQTPKVVLYARHLWHCMHILLYGTMDFVEMYRDLTWQASSSFVAAGEHAISCAQLSGAILETDPKLRFIYRYFGTYLLQSSFIFIILASKLDPEADNHFLILENCTINLRVLDAFVGMVGIEYQKTFTRVLRTILERWERWERRENDGRITGDQQSDDLGDRMDLAILKYRWIPGWNGLWSEDMGSIKDANRRVAPD